MPWGLKRYQQSRNLHFVTFSCYRRQPFLSTAKAARVFELMLERVRQDYKFFVRGYVVMPEHVHLLVSEPEQGSLAVALQVPKQLTSRKLGKGAQFWQRRYYDFSIWTEAKQVEKLRYLHRNPVKRGLVDRPEDWPCSSFRHYATGEEGIVEIESPWTASRRERAGSPLRVLLSADEKTHPSAAPKDGAPSP